MQVWTVAVKRGKLIVRKRPCTTFEYIFALTNKIIFHNIYNNNRTMGWFNMIFITTFIEFLKSLIMLGDFSVFSDTNLFICLMHQIPTTIICCVIAIICCDWLIKGWRKRGIIWRTITFIQISRENNWLMITKTKTN